MNENIERILYESGLTAQGCWDNLDEYDRKSIERFGELIIKECLKLCEKGQNTQTTSVGAANTIRIHFGMRE